MGSLRRLLQQNNLPPGKPTALQKGCHANIACRQLVVTPHRVQAVSCLQHHLRQPPSQPMTMQSLQPLHHSSNLHHGPWCCNERMAIAAAESGGQTQRHTQQLSCGQLHRHLLVAGLAASPGALNTCQLLLLLSPCANTAQQPTQHHHHLCC
jgi:hypothetical protein